MPASTASSLGVSGRRRGGGAGRRDGGNAGTVTIQADRLLISGDGARNANGTLAFTGITSGANSGSTGNAGGVAVTGREIAVRDGGAISSDTSAGAAGAGGTVEVHGGDIRLADGGTITTQSASPQHAGNVTLTVDGSLSLTGGAQITSSASQANAGRITITTPGTLWLTESAITTEATQGEGGQINLRVGRLIGLFSGSGVTTSATGGGSTGNAGNIMIDPQILVVDRDSRIKANAREGNGGRIDLIAENILVWSPLEDRIQAQSERGISGRVDIHAPDQNVGRTLTPLPSGFLDASALLPAACATRVGAPASRFKPNLVASLPSDPNGPLVGSYLSYLGHRPPDRGAPSRGAAAAGTREAAPEPVSAGAGRLSFACSL